MTGSEQDSPRTPRQHRRVGVLHPGQMGAAVAAAGIAAGVDVAWCPAGRSASSLDRAAAAGLRPIAELTELLATSDIVLAIAPPAAAEELAGQVAQLGFDGLYADLNAISSGRVQRIAERLRDGGARFVDGSIIGPPPLDGRCARLYLSGDSADVAAVAGLFAARPIQAVALPGGVGAASALKMSFAGYQKATRSLAGVAHALAAQHGVTQALLDEAGRMAGAPLLELGYLPSVAAQAWRWAPEMHEVADELADAKLPVDLALATADVLARWEPDRDRWDLSVSDSLARLHDRT